MSKPYNLCPPFSFHKEVCQASMADYKSLVKDVYKKRADLYDDGWHADLAEDFVQWLDPKPGEFVLDLACGTGLLTRPMAARVGKKGRVTAVDLTEEMINVGRKKETQVEACEIDWIVADIPSEALLSFPSVEDAVKENGGFDIISICSALVLLPDQKAAVKFWAEQLLSKDGRIITDVPTESITLQLMMTYHLPRALGRSVDLAEGRVWVKDQRSLENLFQSVGLHVEQSLATKSYTGEVWYPADEETAFQTLEEQIKRSFQWIEKEDKLEEAKMVWPKLWKDAVVQHNGTSAVDGGHRLYVCVGRKATSYTVSHAA